MRRLFATLWLWLLLVTLARVAHAQVTIGVELSTTGAAASLGIPNKNAILMGPSVVAGQNIRYVILDDASDPTLAVQNVKRLVSEDKVDMILGPSITPTTLAVMDLVADAKTPVITFGSSSTLISPMDAKRRWIFKTVSNDDVPIATVVNYMARHNVKTLAIIAVNDPYGEGWVQATKQLAAAKNIKLETVERFERGDASTTPQALRVIKSNPDAVLIVAAGTPSVTPHRSLIQHGYKGKIFQSGGAANNDFLRVGGKDVEGAYVVQSPFVVAEELPGNYPTRQAALQFLKNYESKYGPRSAFAAFAFDAVQLMQAAVPVALKKARPGTVEFREALRSALENSKGVVGVSAVYTMSPADHAGINELGMAMLRVQNGNWKLDEAATVK